MALAVSVPVDSLTPEVALAPNQAPEAVQEVALVEDQVSAEDSPYSTAVELAASETVGTGGNTGTVTVALAPPPAPVQVRE